MIELNNYNKKQMIYINSGISQQVGVGKREWIFGFITLTMRLLNLLIWLFEYIYWVSIHFIYLLRTVSVWSIRSRVNWPFDQVLGVIFLSQLTCCGHAFSLKDKGSFLLRDELIQVLCDLGVTSRGFGNDEVKENDTSHDDNQAPSEPKDPIFCTL